MAEDNKNNKTISMNVSIEFKEYLEEFGKKLEDYLWNGIKLRPADLTRILVIKIKERNIKI